MSVPRSTAGGITRSADTPPADAASASARSAAAACIAAGAPRVSFATSTQAAARRLAAALRNPPADAAAHVEAVEGGGCTQ